MEESTKANLFIPRVEGLCAEHVFTRHADKTQAVLVDSFGQVHSLRHETLIGRDSETADLCILEPSVSREHARCSFKDGQWRVRDLDSTNGTYLQGQRVETSPPLNEGALVVFGDVGLVFYPSATPESARAISESILATRERSAARVLRLTEPSSGAAGFAEYQGQRAQLGSTQFSLLWALGTRLEEEKTHPEDVRGFVPSVLLLASLPWNTPRPENNHLKQLVRRTRRALEAIGLADAIESRQRFGYRLTVRAQCVQASSQ